jgi:hypothetical protein
MEENISIIGVCFSCREPFMACPHCVNTLLIDPETNLPPDIVVVNNTYVHRINPDAEAVRRSVKELVCDECIEKRNDVYPEDEAIETSAERHNRGHCQN